MIYYLTPFLNGNLGEAYNAHINSLNTSLESWVCIRDLDTIILNNKIPNRLNEYIKAYPKTGIFTAYTNRIGGHRTQLYNNKISNNDSIIYHKRLTDKLLEKQNSIKQINKPISGFFMLFKIRTFLDIGGFKDGIFIDGNFSKKVLDSGLKINLMENIYIFHYYRLLNGEQYKEHLKIIT